MEYGRKPYIGKGINSGYIPMLRRVTKFFAMNRKPYHDSEFERPYMKDIDYPGMQHFYPQQFRDIPFPTIESPDIPTGSTPDNPCPPDRIINLCSIIGGSLDCSPYKRVPCDTTLVLGMNDGVSLNYCSPLIPVDDLEFSTDKDLPGKILVKLPCKCDEYSVNIICTDKCGGRSNEIINVDAGTNPLTSITGPESPSPSGAYTANGGIGPYVWSISCGSLSGDTSSASVGWDLTGCCAVETISVTDSCGNSVSKEVRGPGGDWFLVQSCVATCLHFGCGHSYGNTTTETISNKWIIGNCGCYHIAETNCSEVLGVPGYINDCPTACGQPLIYGTSGAGYKYAWQCP